MGYAQVTVDFCTDCGCASAECSDAETLDLFFDGVNTGCPTCVPDPSNPGTYVSITGNGLFGSYTLTNFGGFWAYIAPAGGSYSSWFDEACTDPILSTTGTLVITITCNNGVYSVSSTVSTGTDSVQTFAALDVPLGSGATPNTIICGGTVTLSL